METKEKVVNEEKESGFYCDTDYTEWGLSFLVGSTHWDEYRYYISFHILCFYLIFYFSKKQRESHPYET